MHDAKLQAESAQVDMQSLIPCDAMQSLNAQISTDHET